MTRDVTWYRSMFFTKWRIAAHPGGKDTPLQPPFLSHGTLGPKIWTFRPTINEASRYAPHAPRISWVMPIYGMKLYGICPGAKYRGKE